MTLEITEILIIHGSGPDKIFLETRLPNGMWPYNGNATLRLEVASETGESYCRRHFSMVPIRKIITQSSK